MSAQPIPQPSQGTGDEASYGSSIINTLQLSLPGSALGAPASRITINIFASTRNESGGGSRKQFAFTPYFLFTNNVDNQGSRFTRIDLATKSLVKMKLALFDDSLMQAVAASMSLQTQSEVLVQDVQVLPIRQLTILEQSTGAVYSTDPKAALQLQPDMTVIFDNLTSSQADDLTSLVTKNFANFTFTYVYQQSRTWVNSASVTYDNIRASNVFQQLMGNGAAASVSRNGILRVGGMLAASISIKKYIEDPDNIEDLTGKLIDLLFDKAQYQKDIEYEDAEQMKTLSALSIDPNGPDFEARNIETTHDAVASSSDYNQVNKKMLSLEDGGGYGGFTASAKFNNSSELDTAIKQTFSHDWDGTDLQKIPKTICLYQLNSSDFSSSATVAEIAISVVSGAAPIVVPVVQVFPDPADLAGISKNYSAKSFVLVPVGTVLAYSGVTSPAEDGNWLLCDGRPLKASEYPTLFSVLATQNGDGRNAQQVKVPGMDFNLPDLRGMFLRGVDGGAKQDADAATRIAAVPGGSGGDLPGTVQSFATARPHSSFGTDNPGDHNHPENLEISATRATRNDGSLVYNTVAYPGSGSSTGNSGNHTHMIINGGDSETRPTNISVFWIIRAA